MRSINELVNLLSDHANAELGALRAELPELAPSLQPGRILGVGERGQVSDATSVAKPAPDPALDPRTRMLREHVRFAARALATAETLCDDARHRARAKLKLMGNIQVSSQVLAVIASGSTFAFLQSSAPTIAPVSAAVATITGLAGIVIQYLGQGIGMEGDGLKKAYLGLVASAPRARSLREHLQAWENAGTPTDYANEVEKVLGEANALALTVNELIGTVR